MSHQLRNRQICHKYSLSFVFLLFCILSYPAVAHASSQQRIHTQAASGPDLIIESIMLNPSNPGAGDSADVIISIKNQGDEIASGFRIYLYVDPSDTPPTQSTTSTIDTFYGIPLGPGKTFEWTRTGHLFISDAPVIYAWVDPVWENNVIESDETNNLYPASPTGSDLYEYNDSCETAKPIPTNGMAQEHNLTRVDDTPDIDWVSFAVQSDVTYHIQAIGVGADANLHTEMHRGCGISPSLGDGAGFTFTAPENATYYLRISHVDQTYGDDSRYQLQITAEDGCAGFFEPNDICARANDLAVDNQPISHNFCAAGEVDWMRVPVEAGAVYRFTTTNVGANSDVRMNLHTSCNTLGNYGGGPTIRYESPTAGFVYLLTEHAELETFGSDTEYTVQAELLEAGCTEDGFEQDDRPAIAQQIGVDSPAQTRNSCPAGDVDWVKFDAQAGNTYLIETLNLAQDADTEICLYRPNETHIACNDDLSDNNHASRLLWEATENGTYLIRLKDHNVEVEGGTTQYDLQVRTQPCDSDQFEPDDSREQATVIGTDGTAQNHNICQAGDEDWVTFTAETGIYTIQTMLNGTDADTVIELYNQQGALRESNDDYGPGTASQIVYEVTNPGTYYVRISAHNPEDYGEGTDYAVKVDFSQTPPPTPTQSPTTIPPTPIPTPTPPPTQKQTLILLNHTRMATVYGSTAEADAVVAKVDELAQNDNVQGEIFHLDRNQEVQNAYDAWDADPTSIARAQAVTDVIRRKIMQYLSQHDGIQYVVIVGDDRVIPFRRVRDYTPAYSERTYNDVNENHPTGIALKNDYFLSDDFYVDREAISIKSREIYIPDLAIGRLIETPQQIINFIDGFIAQPVTTVDQALISGYDFVDDAAAEICSEWLSISGVSPNCDLIGQEWTGASLFEAQQHYLIQSINGHANHYMEGVAIGSAITGEMIANTTADLSGGLLYTLSCHGGLNVPNNNEHPIDLTEAFVAKGMNYVGNSGYGWGYGGGYVGLSERLMVLYTEQLLRSSQVSMGQALVQAKHQYYQQDQKFSNYDQKVMQQLIFYGLPMYQLQTNGTMRMAQEEFPSVSFAPVSALGPEQPKVTYAINLSPNTLGPDDGGLAAVPAADGTYYALDNHIYTEPGQAVQPLFYGNVTDSMAREARSVVIRSGTYETTSTDPVVASPYNEYVENPSEAVLDDGSGWYPPIPAGVQNLNGESTLTTQFGQYSAAESRQRLYQNMQVDVYYSNSTDHVEPTITVIGAILQENGTVDIKVGADDSSGVSNGDCGLYRRYQSRARGDSFTGVDL